MAFEDWRKARTKHHAGSNPQRPVKCCNLNLCTDTSQSFRDQAVRIGLVSHATWMQTHKDKPIEQQVTEMALIWGSGFEHVCELAHAPCSRR